MSALNYKHLHYFWVVAKAGGIARAAERLHLTPQTVSGQISLFEDVLGYKLFTRVGRRLELNDAGHVVLSYADEIFSLGEELENVLQHNPVGRTVQFRVGIADAVPKSIAYRLLEPSVRLPEALRLVAREGRLTNLLADLAVQRLDLVIADRPMPANVNVRCYNHLLGECGITFFASHELAARCSDKFPDNLHGAPLLIQGEHAAIRPKLLKWFEAMKIRPRIVGEFDDSALLAAFGEAGTGMFAIPSAIVAQVRKQYDLVVIGSTDAVIERFYAISVEHQLTHPAVVAISSAARQGLFGPKNGMYDEG